MMKKIPYNSAAPILAHCDFSPEVMASINPDAAPLALVNQLKEEGYFIELANFYAHALPMREAIWWCIQALKLRQQAWTAIEAQLIEACTLWVREPNERARREIEQQLASLADDRAPKWLGLAVFWSGTGSIAPADNPVVMPVEHLYAKAVAGAVNTAAVLPEWQGHKPFYQAVFKAAFDIANGGKGSAEQGEASCQALQD
ncbi:hypothetical protein C9I98_05505 [Photobacterium sanctipauli]|uniref:Twin-arginine translocation pathway signal n=1 Tax=Photobacterium sanctipauli TaxID=1342794 RepID=A0A2T3NYS9_9GAMM|nr:hypothetical protein [Photobacterium sanctipauli]PSW21392.1 hypothetical protein C9I98_05505 [Photobacterium sanctipauli]